MKPPRLRTYHAPVVRCTECNRPYVLRWGISLSTGEAFWHYVLDCKHKKAPLPPGGPTEEIETAQVSAFARKPGEV